jgi:nicotinamide phosphoribosyltransferase
VRGLDDLVLLTDSYKVSHWLQYPPGTERVYSYLEARGGEYRETVFFGLQYVLRERLAGAVVTRERIAESERLLAAHLGDARIFHRDGWLAILERHGGRLPVSIRAVPEGTVVPTGNVLMTVENTDPSCFWLTSYLETLLVQAWYPATVATQSREMKRVLLRSLEETGDPSLVAFKLHDFGFRGVSSVESAALGGAAHLVNFSGTDTLPALAVAREVYGEATAGFSIPAAEHCTMTAWGKEGEAAAMRNVLRRFPSGTVACVSDSYDVFRACAEVWGRELRGEVLARDGTLVVRPDSGDPPAVVVRVLDILGERLGCARNGKGYRVLDPHVRVIQGDGVDRATMAAVLEAMKRAGWSADNVAFGCGGALLQRLHRDTCGFAFKCSSIVVDGVARDVMKDPVTDARKRSKAGRFALVRRGDTLATVRADAAAESADELVEVFRDGEILRPWTFAEVRARAAEGL